MEKTLRKNKLADFVAKIRGYTVYGPVEESGRNYYRPVSGNNDVSLDFGRTVAPPKGIVFPQREVLLHFRSTNEEGPELKEILPEPAPIVILGVRPCDAAGMMLTDKVFGGDIEDPYYLARRAGAVVVGFTCNEPPSPDCFCTSVGGSPASAEGSDLLFTDLGDSYFVEVITEKGKKLAREAGGVFSDANKDLVDRAKKVKGEAAEKLARRTRAVETVTEKLKGMFDSPVWEEEARSCIRCGVCTYLCPTCHCFDINDEVLTRAPLVGARVRTWDTCQFPDFTMHSSGHNPRPNRASRLRQRVLHKFLYFVENFGVLQCTGCGRCISYCPVGIDIVDVLEKADAYEP